MIKKVVLIMNLTALIALFSGCAVHKRYMISSTSVNSNNYSYIKNDVKCTAKATSIFGIGSHSRRSLVNDAKKQLLESTPLKANQTLANLSVNWKMLYALPFVITNRCTITADIVELK
jgi:hypothetical protein